MADFVLKYADPQGVVHERVESGTSEDALRERYAAQGLLIYSIAPKRLFGTSGAGSAKRPKLALEQFLIFNQQFVTLIRAGLPILKSLELLEGNIRNRGLQKHVASIRAAVKTGTPLSDAFRAERAFPPIYVTSLMAGEKSGSLPEVIDRYVQYQKVTLTVRKKVLVSLIYPCILVVLVLSLILFLMAYVVPEFASLYDSMDAELPRMTQWLVAFGVTFSENFWLISGTFAASVTALVFWMRSSAAQSSLDQLKINAPIFGVIWRKYQVSQICRLLSTLLNGGIPLLPALETTGESMGSQILRRAISHAKEKVREGQPLSKSLAETKVIPPLAVEMIQVGESTGALPAMLDSVAEFFDDDVSNAMTAALSLIEPVIMLVMGAFVAFVLISLYLPMFSLAGQL
jgi:type IV pilus assembly protein PilC